MPYSRGATIDLRRLFFRTLLNRRSATSGSSDVPGSNAAATAGELNLKTPDQMSEPYVNTSALFAYVVYRLIPVQPSAFQFPRSQTGRTPTDSRNRFL